MKFGLHFQIVYFWTLGYFSFLQVFEISQDSLNQTVSWFCVFCSTWWFPFSCHVTLLMVYNWSCDHTLFSFHQYTTLQTYNFIDTRLGKSFDLLLHKILFRLAGVVKKTLQLWSNHWYLQWFKGRLGVNFIISFVSKITFFIDNYYHNMVTIADYIDFIVNIFLWTYFS